MRPDAKKILKIGALSIFFLFIVAYGFFGSHSLVVGIQIKNVTMNGQPAKTGIQAPNNILEISGNAKNAVHVILSGREISIDEAGNFHETIAIYPGYNIINIK